MLGGGLGQGRVVGNEIVRSLCMRREIKMVFEVIIICSVCCLGAGT